jgi:hypothetical protein
LNGWAVADVNKYAGEKKCSLPLTLRIFLGGF